ncbi:hypothetical protein PINS_up018870 [Pythium insidiosum]|nr:hypothetical protein PINS_up018870 [Pythium insidiosum]
MEVELPGGSRALSAEVFLEYGVVVDGGRVRYRFAFCRSIEPTIASADACLELELQEFDRSV